jgi:Lrp/AsnC family leucine-responsive transcriptional regulator
MLELLQHEGRIPNAALAERLHITPSPCLRRLRALEAAGVVSGYRAVLDREAVGLGLTAFIDVQVERHTDETAATTQERLASLPEVVSCHLVSGTADFLLEVVVPDLRAYERFLLGTLLKVPLVRDLRSTFAIKTVKAGGVLPLGHLAGGR